MLNNTIQMYIDTYIRTYIITIQVIALQNSTTGEQQGCV